jgi:polyphosphate kinase
VLVRVVDPGQCEQLRQYLDLGMDDGTSSWWLDSDGTWSRRARAENGRPLRDIQETLIRLRRTTRSNDG